MIRKLITTDDFVTTKQTYTRFGEKVECKPIVTYFRAGLLKDYKNLNTDAEVLFFDGREVANDAGQGMYRKVYTKHTEDIGVYIKVGNHFYKRQYTGAVNLGWFGDDTNAIRTALKYGFIRFEQKTYNLDYDAYSLTNNVKIDLNGATIIIKGTPIYGFFFRVNNYILKIMNGTIKAHSGITNIARFTNASAITTDFRTNIKFLDLEGNQLDLHQLPNTNEILYRGVNSRLDINGRKHFTSTDGLRTLRIKEGIAAPTDDNQLVPATYESEEFDYSNMWKSSMETTIEGVKTFTNFTYNKKSISIYNTLATKSALEYYLQIYKLTIEKLLVNKFIIGTYFKLNAYYISCEVYKEVANSNNPAQIDLVVDEEYTPNINTLFNNTRFNVSKTRSNMAVFEFEIGNYKKYKWKIHKRIFSKDNYTFKGYVFIQKVIVYTNLLSIEYNSSIQVIYYERYYNDIIGTRITQIPLIPVTDSEYVWFYLDRSIFIGSSYPTYLYCTAFNYRQNIDVLYTDYGTCINGMYPNILKQDYLCRVLGGWQIYKNFTYKTCTYFDDNTMQLSTIIKMLRYMNENNCYIRLKSTAFADVKYKDINNIYGLFHDKPYMFDGRLSSFYLSGKMPVANPLAYGLATHSVHGNKCIVYMDDILEKNYDYTATYGYSTQYITIAKCGLPDRIFIGNVETGEATLDEPFVEDISLYNKKYKFIPYTLNTFIGLATRYDSLITTRCDTNGTVTAFVPDVIIVKFTYIIQYFDIAAIPKDKTIDDYTYEELENMIVNPS